MEESQNNKRRPRVLIAGAGYVGARLAHELRSQSIAHSRLWVQSPETAESLRREGYSVIAGDISKANDWRAIGAEQFDVVVQATSSGKGGAEAYRRVFIDGFRQIAKHQPGARRIFISSTSVYGQKDGSVISEASPAEPKSQTSRLLKRAEDIALTENATVLRVAGIYGPHRSILLRKLREGRAEIQGDGKRFLNQIHRDDVVGAIIHIMEEPQTLGQIFNVCDDSHPNYVEFYEWLSQQMNLPMPPVGATPTARKRGLTNKQVSNAKLKATGWQPLYPNFRDGYRAVLESESQS